MINSTRAALIIGLSVLMMRCDGDQGKTKSPDRFYLTVSRDCDTVYLDKPNFDTANLTTVKVQDFNDYCSRNKFSGLVIKMNNRPAPVDGETEYYFTPDLGIIFSKSTTWLNYTRLHSTNDSIEKRINAYIDHILTRTDLITAGNITVVKIDNVEAESPKSDK